MLVDKRLYRQSLLGTWSTASSEVDRSDLLEANVNGRLVDVYETFLERVEVPRRGLVGTRYCGRFVVPENM